ncbi:relaxase/mobilization nuclease domain-containing protein [Mucilaginibacter rubeus]|uniref:relaxase/mobilization nuclease domain-containing protein n=1 Tax=Mucilaginibacter rubeus TaxID=2027860 RepID=UPI00166307B0|nr:relaxase/mobilization nuclease domain-containing protein [Mucilaginibacter rubeus]GGA95618.1 hypothetical protein GCM10011500_09220 [Mucilaginibacter rubeus]
MIAHILEKPSMTFAGVRYNTDKMDLNRGELMLKANFGALQGLNHPRPQDLINYLLMISSQNTRVKKNTQFHAVISASGRNYDKHELTKTAEMWLKEMGYGNQPYLVVFHKDTNNNHVHMVSSRIDKNGIQINRDFERDRALKSIDKVLGYTFALQYRFSTIAQFYMILENSGLLGRDYRDKDKLQRKIDKYVPDRERIEALKTLFNSEKYKGDFIRVMKETYNVDLIFHSSEGKKPYGYTVIDHRTKQVFKGSEILSLKLLLESCANHTPPLIAPDFREDSHPYDGEPGYYSEYTSVEGLIGPIIIADDVDDQQVLGMKRRRMKKARVNTR